MNTTVFSRVISQALLRWAWLALRSVLGLLLVIAIGVTAFLYFAPTFGGAASGVSLERIRLSPNYRDGRFFNLTDTQIDTRDPAQPRSLSAYVFPAEDKNPTGPLPSRLFNAEQLDAGHFVWFGHSTVLFNTGQLLVLADPVFNRASPVPMIGNAFPMQHHYQVGDLPPRVDVVVISHDHYDHLDHLAIAELTSRTSRFLVPLGVAAHLQRWGVPLEKITELDWYDSETVSGNQFTLTPARHFSGRGLTNRFSTLWGSWVVKSETLNVFFSGDSGYFDELKTIGERFGPFDIAFIENGAYSADWRQIHMMPEQSAQASVDLQAAIYFPIHWSRFDLALHPWDEPVKRATAAAQVLGVKVATPLIGEVFTLDDVPQSRWWE